jgi:uncharacterized spore protein YtfJ
MANLNQLQKQRIDKIKSLQSNQIKNYVDVLTDEVAELHDFNTIVSANDGENRLNEIADLYLKLNEITELTSGTYNNIKNYIAMSVNDKLLTAKTVYDVKSVVDYAKLKNMLILDLIKELHNNHINLQFYLILFHGLFSKLNYINQVSPENSELISAIADVKNIRIAEFKKVISKTVDVVDDNIERINKLFYSDDEIVSGISELENDVKNIENSADECDMLLKKFGIIDVYSDLIDCYEQQLHLKEFYVSVLSEINKLFESENVFYEYSIADFENVSGIDFDSFMKYEPKFNLKDFELKYS